MIRRRTLIGAVAGNVLGVPLWAFAQPVRKVFRIGILGNFEAADVVVPEPRSPFVGALVRGLRDLGYVHGQHFVIEPRGSAGNPELFSRLAIDLVGLQVGVIVSTGPGLLALRQVTSTIPIVMTASSDPLEWGSCKVLHVREAT